MGWSIDGNQQRCSYTNGASEIQHIEFGERSPQHGVIIGTMCEVSLAEQREEPNECDERANNRHARDERPGLRQKYPKQTVVIFKGNQIRAAQSYL